MSSRENEMIKVSSKSLDEALYQASIKLECSVSEMTYEVVQCEKRGFFGFGKRDAIVVASIKSEIKIKRDLEKNKITKNETIKEIATEEIKKEEEIKVTEKRALQVSQKRIKEERVVEKKSSNTPSNNTPKDVESKKRYTKDRYKTNSVIDNFNRDIDEIAIEIEDELNRVFAYSCFALERIKVSVHDKQTIFIEFSGDDAALLIGKEGYRYKALSYMLFNWINSKYENVMIRLEIAEFLKNQEEMIKNYLQPIVEYIKKNGKGQTKPLDGVLAHIALKELREIFPNKYVSFRNTNDGDRYIVINDFLTSQES